MREIRIGNVKIGPEHPPFIIAEMSGNHNQSLERALEIVDAAADAGAHAIKLQTYSADTMTIKARHGLFQIDDNNSLWKGRNLYELYQLAHTPWKWHKPLFDRAAKHGLIAFSSPFDSTAVDFLSDLDVPCFKIASFENTDHPLLAKVARTGKPVIMSTGLATLADLVESVQVLEANGCKQLVLLKCTSSYPASPENSNLATIPHMAEIWPQSVIGLSDHTLGIGAPLAAIALGARVIEKHFTLSRKDGGVDSAFSLEPPELKALVVESERAFQAIGKVFYGIAETEKDNRRFKRSIYVVKPVSAGEAFTPENVRVIRPGDGLEPKYLQLVLGRSAARDLEPGHALRWEDI